MRHAKTAHRRIANVEIPAHADKSAWTNGTVLYLNDEGDVVGYGCFKRTAKGKVELLVNFEPSGVSLLALSPESFQTQPPEDD